MYVVWARRTGANASAPRTAASGNSVTRFDVSFFITVPFFLGVGGITKQLLPHARRAKSANKFNRRSFYRTGMGRRRRQNYGGENISGRFHGKRSGVEKRRANTHTIPGRGADEICPAEIR